MVPQIAGLEALVCASEHEAAWAERMLLEHRKPRWNRVAGGLENPVFVRLDSAAPAIRVRHEVLEAEDARWYGPFLGGTATRMAVAAIERVYPLTYTRSRLTGTERDLARLQGVGADDAAELIREIDLVLRGDPTAVALARDLLVARRDEAAGRELYEVASRINDEAVGLAWGASTLRFVGTADLDLVASCGGQRVALTLRGGRLRTWEQAAATEEDLVAPEEWRDFLSRNAALASQLAAHPVR